MTPLKEATSEKHKIAERMPFNVRMFKGEMSKQDYLAHLVQQLEIFKAIESVGLPHDGLAREQAVQQDIDELLKDGVQKQDVLESTNEYVRYLTQLSYDSILPHVYLNYLAIMFGGQMMKKAVPSSGHMYDFPDMQSSMLAVRSVQKDEWADEVNKGFDFIIEIFDQLEKIPV